MNYLEIMKKALKTTIVDKEEKPDLSIKDWNFVLECMVTLNNIFNRMDDINPERFKDNCVLEFEVLGDITGHNMFDWKEIKDGSE